MAYTQITDVRQYDSELGLGTGLTSLRDLTIAQRYTVWGDSIADGISPEWIQTNTNGGTVTSSGGEGLLQTSANALGSTQVVGPVINYYPGQVDWINSAVRLGDTGSTGNTRRWGRFTISGGVPQDGFAFELIDTVFYATSFKGGVATRVASTSWTKFSTAPYTLDTSYMGAEIRFTSNSCQFYINNVLRHTASGGSNPITNTLNLPIAAQNINTSGATNRVLGIRNIGQGRFGTQPNSGVISIINSSTTALAANGVFTGVAEDITTLEKITISVFSNVASAIDGLSIQQSMDGTNWDLTDTYTIPAGSGKTFSVPKQARYLRVVYTNGGTIQASFRLQTLFSTTGKSSSNRASDGYTNETDLEQNQTFPMLWNGTTWDRIRGDITNGLDVDVTRLPSLIAGSAIIGKVGLDQTTPGTTNAISIAQLGTNTISTGNGIAGTGVLRVAIASDNSPITIQGTQDARTSGTITTASSTVGPVSASNRNLATIDISGTHAGVTFVIEGSTDGGTTYNPIQSINNATGVAASNGTWTPGTNATGSYDLAIGAYTHVRVRSTAWTSGTMTVGIALQTFAYDPVVASIDQGPAANGAAITGNPVRIGASDGTTTRDINATLKGTQGAYAVATQDLKDAGRNQTNYYMAIQIVSTATDALMSLTGYKSGAAVAATTTPAVVTAGKTYRITSITMDYTTIVTTPGSVRFTLRANTSGVVAITSPAVAFYEIGEPSGAAPVAGKKNTVTIPIPDGIEFPAGTGIGVSMVGLSATGAAAVVGYGRITINGYEY